MSTFTSPITLVSQAARRRAVVLLYAAIVLLPVLLLTIRSRFGTGSPAIAVTLLVTLVVVGLLWVTVLGSVLTAGQAVADGADDELDERQLAVRHRARSQAYRVALVVISALSLYALASDSLGLWMPGSSDDWFVVAWPVLMTVATLPNAIMVWSVPDGRP